MLDDLSFPLTLFFEAVDGAGATAEVGRRQLIAP